MALLGSLLWDSFAALAIVVLIAYLYFASILNHFKNRNIPYVKPLPIVGNYLGVLTGRYTVNNIIRPLYEELKKHKFGGYFQGTRPVLMLCDPELIKLALTKDFSGLHDRGLPFDEKNDPLSATLFNMTGARWKNLRMKLSPVFTSGKLKQMFPLIKAVSETLSAELLKGAEKGDSVELKSLLTRFSTDVVGTCAFGVECNSVKDPTSPFFTMSQSLLKPNLLVLIRFSLLINSKFFSRLIPFKAMFPNVQDFFINLMKDTIKYRKENNYDRNDFVKLLMQQQKNDEGKSPEAHPQEVIFTDMIIVAQAFLFFLAGLDSQSGTIGFALHHLCVDPRMQEDLADEITSVVSHYNGEITYEGLKEMKLLGMVVNEAMRLYTPVGILFREVTAPKFPIPGSSVTLKKGDRVAIPVEGLHNDPEFFPEPGKFDPYRFTEDAISRRHPFTYLPFGEGPRVCIAERFALLLMQLCLAQLIKDFKFSVCSKTQIPMKLKTRSFTVTPTKGFYFKIEKRAV